MEIETDWGKSADSRLLERWPKTVDGEPETPALLCNCKSLRPGGRYLCALFSFGGCSDPVLCSGRRSL